MQDDCFVSINLNGVGLFIREGADCCMCAQVRSFVRDLNSALSHDPIII